jgi:hypothetical protein
MSDSLMPTSRSGIWPLPGWALAAIMMMAIAAMGGALGDLARPLFVLCCGAVGWYAWQQSPGAHLQVALMLFAFAPFVRRVVDLSIGYDTNGLMLIGPFLAIIVPAPRLLQPQHLPAGRMISLLLTVGSCAAYATVLTLFQGDWLNAATGALKWFAPLLYATILLENSDRDEVLRAAGSAFLVILPLTAIYGVLQYIDPSAWDIYWMGFAPIVSVGEPVPYGVRVFSTMNSPGSFATFTAIGLLIVCFTQRGWIASLSACLAGVGLLLSLYRTAWISLAVGLLFCALFPSTRRRALAIIIGTVIAVALASTVPPFGDVISERVATFFDGTQDGSALERFDEFVTLWNRWDSCLFGVGFSSTDVGSAGKMPVDGTIIDCWLSMGIVVGLICLSQLIMLIGNTFHTAWLERRQEAIVIGALGCGALAQLPLASIAYGETGFLFWTFLAMAMPGYQSDEGFSIR